MFSLAEWLEWQRSELRWKARTCGGRPAASNGPSHSNRQIRLRLVHFSASRFVSRSRFMFSPNFADVKERAVETEVSLTLYIYPSLSRFSQNSIITAELESDVCNRVEETRWCDPRRCQKERCSSQHWNNARRTKWFKRPFLVPKFCSKASIVWPWESRDRRAL